MLILASSSPRRHELLLAAGIPHIVQPSSTPEVMLPGETPENLVQRLAEQKARAISPAEGDIVLGADTVVVLDGKVFLKPVDAADAARMLRLLSGRDHRVITGVCLLSTKKVFVGLCSTRVSVLPISDPEMEEYTRSGEPLDKAGAYAIQGLASKFIAGIEGCYHNVVGLPVALVYRHLKDF